MASLNKPVEGDIVHVDGSSAPVEILSHPIDYAGKPHRAIAIRDLRARKQAEQHIRFLAHYDVLTRLPNRATFNDKLDQAIEEASASLGARRDVTFRRIVLPLVRPALLAGMTVLFIRAMTAISATIFLVSLEWSLVTVRILEGITNLELGQASASQGDTAIRDVLKQYATALERLDADAVKKVQPSIEVESLRKAFKEMRALNVTIDDVRVLASDASIARVSCKVTQTLTPRVGSRKTTAVTRVMRLRRDADMWVIDGFER